MDQGLDWSSQSHAVYQPAGQEDLCDLQALLGAIDLPQDEQPHDILQLSSHGCEPLISEKEVTRQLAISRESFSQPYELQAYSICADWNDYCPVRYKVEGKIRLAGNVKNQQMIKQDQADVELVVYATGFTNIGIYVQRIRKKGCTKTCNAFRLSCVPQTLVYGQTHVTVNLNSVYKVGDEIVYSLPTANMDSANNFRLLVLASNAEDNVSRMIEVCPSFKIVGKEKAKTSRTDDHKKRKRPYLELASTDFGNMQESGSIDCDSLSSGPSVNTHGRDTLDITELKAQSISAGRARFGSLEVKKFETSNGDIAYHIRVHRNNKYIIFQEGQVVALIYDENEKTVLQPLSRQNMKTSFGKGIISRSQYLSAHAPESNTDVTETVCFMGLVPVLVKGKVKAQDRIFPSLDCAGTAISERSYRYRADVYHDIAWLGTAWETVETDENEVALVQCYIQIGTQFVGGHLSTELTSVVNDVRELSTSKRKTRQCCGIMATLAAILLVLIACLLWQVLVPGSAYHLWRCKEGSMPDHYASFLFKPNLIQHYKVIGNEFTHQGLLAKTKEALTPFKEGRYFLNTRRCSHLTFPLDRTKRNLTPYAGPIIFVVAKNCSEVYYHNDIEETWIKYKSAIQIKCYPP